MSDDWTPREKRLMAWGKREVAALLDHSTARPLIAQAEKLEREASGPRHCPKCGADDWIGPRFDPPLRCCARCGVVTSEEELGRVTDRQGPDSAADERQLYWMTAGRVPISVGFTLAQVRELAAAYRFCNHAMTGCAAAPRELTPFLPLLEAKDGK